MDTALHPFPPIVDSRTRLLILGSFPSLVSVERAFYYGHPRNAFWPIMADVFGRTFADNAAKQTFLLERGIGLWDVAAACRRTNSSDTGLTDIVPNDIPGLLREYPGIRAVGFTGRKAYDLARRFFGDIGVAVTLLPSTSPAYAAMSYEAKREIYRGFFGDTSVRA